MKANISRVNRTEPIEDVSSKVKIVIQPNVFAPETCVCIRKSKQMHPELIKAIQNSGSGPQFYIPTKYSYLQNMRMPSVNWGNCMRGETKRPAVLILTNWWINLSENLHPNWENGLSDGKGAGVVILGRWIHSLGVAFVSATCVLWRPRVDAYPFGLPLTVYNSVYVEWPRCGFWRTDGWTCLKTYTRTEYFCSRKMRMSSVNESNRVRSESRQPKNYVRGRIFLLPNHAYAFCKWKQIYQKLSKPIENF